MKRSRQQKIQYTLFVHDENTALACVARCRLNRRVGTYHKEWQSQWFSFLDAESVLHKLVAEKRIPSSFLSAYTQEHLFRWSAVYGITDMLANMRNLCHTQQLFSAIPVAVNGRVLAFVCPLFTVDYKKHPSFRFARPYVTEA